MLMTKPQKFEDVFPSYTIRASRNKSRKVSAIQSFDNLYGIADIDLVEPGLKTEGDVCMVVLIFKVFTVVEPKHYWNDPSTKSVHVRVLANTSGDAQQLALDWMAKNNEEYFITEPTDLTPWKKHRDC